MNEDARTLDVVDHKVFPKPAPEGLQRIVHLVYGLHAVAIVIGLTGAATVVGSFLFGLPSITAVIINYVKRGEARGTWLESHFEWQIATFWWAMGVGLVLLLFAITIIGLPIYWLGLILLGLWLVYRVVRGWLQLNAARPLA